MKHILKYLPIVIFTATLAVSACKETAVDNFFVKEIIKDSDSSVVRGINIYAEKKEIIKSEDKKALISDDENMLEYKYYTKEIKELSVVYYLDSDGVYQIEIKALFVNSKFAAQALAEFIKHFTDKYGNPEKQNDIFYWDLLQKQTSIDIDSSKLSDEILVITFSFLE